MNMKLPKKLEKLLDKMNKEWYNKICWRCGEKFYHGFSDICSKCEKEIRNVNKSK